jgi:proline iminopeptidase
MLLGVILFCCCAAIAQEYDSIIVTNAVLHYSVQGQGQPILLLSGGPGNSADQLSTLAQRLSTTNRCILFEQRGTGRSHTKPLDSTTINLDQAMRDITLLLRQLGIGKITILGHSWGAMLGISYAIKHPDAVAKLVLIGPGPLDMSGYDLLADNIVSRASKQEKLFMKEVEDSMAHRTASKELLKAYNKTIFRFFFFDPLKVDSLWKMIKCTANDTTFELIMQDLARIKYDISAGISQLDIPLLVVCGRQDPVGVFPTFEIKELNKKAKICWIEKSGHFPWAEKPEPFYSEVLSFLK